MNLTHCRARLQSAVAILCSHTRVSSGHFILRRMASRSPVMRAPVCPVIQFEPLSLLQDRAYFGLCFDIPLLAAGGDGTVRLPVALLDCADAQAARHWLPLRVHPAALEAADPLTRATVPIDGHDHAYGSLPFMDYYQRSLLPELERTMPKRGGYIPPGLMIDRVIH